MRLLAQLPPAFPSESNVLVIEGSVHIPSFPPRVLALTTLAISPLPMRLTLPQLLPLKAGGRL